MNNVHVAKRLLIIDDDENILKSLVRALSRDGYEIHSFTSPIDALSIMQELSFGVIMSDQCMPNIEGDEFLLLAKHYQPKAIRIVLSGYYETHSVAKIVDRSQAWRYIAKPWDNENIRALVKEGFERFEKTRLL